MLRASLLALALGTFALGIAEFAMMAILGEVAASLGVSIPEAGDFISAYSIGVACGAIALPFLNCLPLKHILLGLCGLMALGNLASALAPGYLALLCARFLAGLPHGAYFGVGALVATRIAGYGEKASAIAIMSTGMTMANVLGVPLAAFFSSALNWRLTFALVVLASLLALIFIWKCVPALAPNSAKKCGDFKSQLQFLRQPAPWLIFGGTFFGQGALYCWYSYIEPAMVRVAGFSTASMSWIMVLCGAGMVLGGLFSGRLADRRPPGMLTGSICLLMLPTLFCLWFFAPSKMLAPCFAFLGAAEIFALGAPLQYLIVSYSKGGELLGGAGIQVAFNVSNAFSAWLGGLAIAHGLGFASPALVGMPLAMLGAACLFYFHHLYAKK